MARTLTLGNTWSGVGININRSSSLTYENDAASFPSISLAKAGELTTRTDDNTGTITGPSGHGITTGAIVDMLWANADGTYGYRAGVTVGTVSGTSIPFDLGSGDNLPVVNTDISIMVRDEEALTVDGDNVQAILATSPGPVVITLADASDATLMVIPLTSYLNNYTYGWDVNSGVTNPIAGDDVAKVFFSQWNTESSVTPSLNVLHN